MSLPLWKPESEPSGTTPATAVVESYKLLLEVTRKDLHKAFLGRLAADPLGAEAEAIIFAWLRDEGHKPEIADLPGKGGADFLCRGRSPFHVEVTTLATDAVSARSKLEDRLEEGIRPWLPITQNLRSKTSVKAQQLEGTQQPAILAVCVRHIASAPLMGKLGAETLMLSETKITGRADRSGTDITTDFKMSAFVGEEKGELVLKRTSISAILLVELLPRGLSIAGLLHPKPVAPFNYRTMASIPFLRLGWPLVDGAIELDWVIGDPQMPTFRYVPFQMTRAELTGTSDD